MPVTGSILAVVILCVELVGFRAWHGAPATARTAAVTPAFDRAAALSRLHVLDVEEARLEADLDRLRNHTR